jgi:hypothetical protein
MLSYSFSFFDYLSAYFKIHGKKAYSSEIREKTCFPALSIPQERLFGRYGQALRDEAAGSHHAYPQLCPVSCDESRSGSQEGSTAFLSRLIAAGS